jgi:hypothetical protein
VRAGEATPTEHLAPGELVEGNVVVFGLKMPRDLQIDRRYADAAYGSASASVGSVGAYFQQRVRDGRVTNTLNESVVENAAVPGQPGLRVEIRVAYAPTTGMTDVEIRDVTPVVDNLPKDDTARWRAAGMTPEGKPLDPKHLH